MKKFKTKLTFKIIYAVGFALLPVFWTWRFLFTEMSVSYVVVSVLTIIAMIKLVGKKILKKDILGVYLFFIYYLFRAEGDYFHYLVFSAIIIVNILAFYHHIEDAAILQQTIMGVSFFASLIVILQNFIHFTLGIHVQVLFPQLALSGSSGYAPLWSTGYAVGSSYYRASAFFPEPSHMCQYCFIGLLIALYGWAKEGKKINTAAIITIGMILATSSMGILLAIACWVWGIFVRGDKVIIRRMLNVVFGGGLLVVVIFIFYELKLFNIYFMLGRIFGEVEGYNAVAGRNFADGYYLTGLNFRQQLYGFGLVNRPDVYMVGMSGFRYTIGLVGAALFIVMNLISIRRIQNISTAIAIAFVAITFGAQTNQLSALVFYLPLVYSQTKQSTEEKRRRNFEK